MITVLWRNSLHNMSTKAQEASLLLPQRALKRWGGQRSAHLCLSASLTPANDSIQATRSSSHDQADEIDGLGPQEQVSDCETDEAEEGRLVLRPHDAFYDAFSLARCIDEVRTVQFCRKTAPQLNCCLVHVDAPLRRTCP